MNKDEIKQALISDGWRIEPGLHSRMAFMAWKKMTDVPNCQSNEKPPCIGIEYYSTQEGELAWESCEVCIAGDIGDGEWVSLKMYAIKTNDLLTILPKAVEVLTRCWIAACQ